jgi:hypothetical protein
VFNLKFKAISAAVAPTLLLTVACTKQPADKADAPATKAEAPAVPREGPVQAPAAKAPAAEVDTYVPQTDTAATAEFNKAVAAYVEIHNKADGQVPSLKRTDDPKEISSREIALGDAIRELRASARPGDMMTRDIAKEFRRLIKKDYQGRSREDRRIFLDEVPHFRPMVNQRYPSEWPLATFPATLLVVMPKLPDILEYRLLSEALILRDVKANIVADFIFDVY